MSSSGSKSDSDAFFRQKKAAAVLKHGVLTRYLVPWVQKVGSTAQMSRVVVVDGYAGAGKYEDGSLGSPVIMARTARAASDRSRKLDLVLVEQKKAHYDALCANLAGEGHKFALGPLQGSMETHLDRVLTFAGSAPLFAFLDPYGLGLSFEEVVRIMLREGKTEVLLNFSAHAVRRIGGLNASSAPVAGKEKTLQRLDAVCGGDWWREVHRAHSAPEDVSEAVAAEYLSRLSRAVGAGGWQVPVSVGHGLKPAYSLVFLTRHIDGFVLFGNAVSKSMEDWRAAVATPDLFGEDVMIRAMEEALAAKWVARIRLNLLDLLRERDTIHLGTEWGRVFQGVEGLAREMHLRSALKALDVEQRIEKRPTGDLWKAEIRRR